MEDGTEREHVAPANPLEDATDLALSRVFGRSLEAATMRLVIYLAILCAIAATAGALI